MNFTFSFFLLSLYLLSLSVGTVAVAKAKLKTGEAFLQVFVKSVDDGSTSISVQVLNFQPDSDNDDAFRSSTKSKCKVVVRSKENEEIESTFCKLKVGKRILRHLKSGPLDSSKDKPYERAKLSFKLYKNADKVEFYLDEKLKASEVISIP